MTVPLSFPLFFEHPGRYSAARHTSKYGYTAYTLAVYARRFRRCEARWAKVGEMFDGIDIERQSSRFDAFKCVRTFGRLRRMVSGQARPTPPFVCKCSKKPTKSTPAPRPALRSFGAGGDFFAMKSALSVRMFPGCPGPWLLPFSVNPSRTPCVSAVFGCPFSGTLERARSTFRIAKALQVGVVRLVMRARSGPSVCPRARFSGGERPLHLGGCQIPPSQTSRPPSHGRSSAFGERGETCLGNRALA